MKTERAYCTTCEHEVRLVLTDAPARDGQANLPDGAQLVCLDYQEACKGGRCPSSGRAGVVMGVRLAKSHLSDLSFETIHAVCEACGEISDLEVIDDQIALCTRCETTVRWGRVRLSDASEVVIAAKQGGAP